MNATTTASKFDVVSLVRDASFHVGNDVYEKLLAKAEALPRVPDIGYSAVVRDTLLALPAHAVESVSKFTALSECFRATCYGGTYGETGRTSLLELLTLEVSDTAAIAAVQTKLDAARGVCVAS